MVKVSTQQIMYASTIATSSAAAATSDYLYYRQQYDQYPDRRRQGMMADAAVSQPPPSVQGNSSSSSLRSMWLLALVVLMLANDIRIALRVAASSNYHNKSTTTNRHVDDHAPTSRHRLLAMATTHEESAYDDEQAPPRRFNIILNYRIEAKVVGIKDYGHMERISGFSERLVDVAIGEERSSTSTTDIIQLHKVDHQYAQLAIRSQSQSQSICDYQHISLGIPMSTKSFGTTGEFQSVATCTNNHNDHEGMTYTILLQVSIVEVSAVTTANKTKSYDVSLMNHAIHHEYDRSEGWRKIERSDTYGVKNLSAGKMVLDPEHNSGITLLEDGPGYVVIELDVHNSDVHCSYKYYMAIAMEKNGMGFSNGMETLKPCSKTHNRGQTFAMLLHAFVVEV